MIINILFVIDHDDFYSNVSQCRITMSIVRCQRGVARELLHVNYLFR